MAAAGAGTDTEAIDGRATPSSTMAPKKKH